MRLRVIISVGMGSDVLQMGRVGRLATFCQQPKILEDIILGMSPHPRAVALSVSTFHGVPRVRGRFSKQALPYIIVYRLHHPGLSLPNSHLQTFGLAVAGQCGRSMADGTVRVHPDDRLSRFGPIVSGIHGLVCEVKKSGKKDSNVFMRCKIKLDLD